jgi:hypothetical protein
MKLHFHTRPGAAGRIAGLAIALTLSFAFAGQSGVAEALLVDLKPAAVSAWDRYVALADARVQSETADPNRYLIEDFLPAKDRAEIQRKLEAGEIVVSPMRSAEPGGAKPSAPDAEIHHLWGAVLIPGAEIGAVLRFLQDYDNHARRFADVEKSKLLSRNGNHFRFYFRLKRTKAIVTAYYNTEQECDYFMHGPGKVSSRSIAVKIAELENAGTPSERERKPGEDRGFLWRLVSWWRLKQTDKGVIVECESASLSRNIPAVIKWFPPIAAYIRSTPRESLESVLTSVLNHSPKR